MLSDYNQTKTQIQIFVHQNLLTPQDGISFWSILLKLKLDNFTVYKYKEVKFTDINTILASVGGSLSLFLGFSCYQLGSKLLYR